MVINNCNLNELRKEYANNDKFIIRIREQKYESNKEDCKDIVYCEGIKAFYVENKKCTDNTVKICIPENIYKVNQTNISNIINTLAKDNKDEKSFNFKDELNSYLDKVENAINNFVTDKVILKQELKSYFEVTIKKDGKFNFGKAFFEKTGNTTPKYIGEQVILRLRLLNERLNKLGTGFDLEKTIVKLKKIKSAKDKIPFELENFENLSAFELNKIEVLMILYTTFTLKFEKSKVILKQDDHSGFAKPEFNYSSTASSINYNDKEAFNKFNENIEKAILNYEECTKVELEKKYQHSFMTKNKLKNYDNLSSVIPFEEECYTYEKDEDTKKDTKDEDTKKGTKDNDSGRIDCIFVDPKENKSDIYLIELKVNEGVIGEVNNLDYHGINTHLVDIDNLLQNKGKLNLNNFVKNIVNRYNYRNEILNNSSRISDSENCVLHYWIVCAIKGDNFEDEKKHAQAVLKKIDNLKNDDYIKNLKSTNLLEEHKTEECLLKSADGSEVELKLLFDIWNLKGNREDTKFLTIKELKEYYDIL